MDAMFQQQNAILYKKVYKIFMDLSISMNEWNELYKTSRQQTMALENFLPRYEVICKNIQQNKDNTTTTSNDKQLIMNQLLSPERLIPRETFVTPTQTDIDSLGVLAFLPGYAEKLKSKYLFIFMTVLRTQYIKVISFYSIATRLTNYKYCKFINLWQSDTLLHDCCHITTTYLTSCSCFFLCVFHLIIKPFLDKATHQIGSILDNIRTLVDNMKYYLSLMIKSSNSIQTIIQESQYITSNVFTMHPSIFTPQVNGAAITTGSSKQSKKGPSEKSYEPTIGEIIDWVDIMVRTYGTETYRMASLYTFVYDALMETNIPIYALKVAEYEIETSQTLKTRYKITQSKPTISSLKKRKKEGNIGSETEIQSQLENPFIDLLHLLHSEWTNNAIKETIDSIKTMYQSITE